MRAHRDCARSSLWKTNTMIQANGPVTTAPPCEPPVDHELVLKVSPMPKDLNANGDIFGGWVMAQVDVAGGIMAMRRAGGRATTVAVNEFVFKQPVRVGDLLSFYAKVLRIGTTSMTVNVEVLAERLCRQGRYIKVTEAKIVFVAIDSEGKPRPVPALDAPDAP